MSKGADILMALEDAAAGDFAAVTVHGQTWVRRDAFKALITLYAAAKRIDANFDTLQNVSPIEWDVFFEAVSRAGKALQNGMLEGKK